MSTWQVLFSIPLSTSNVSAEQSSEFFKVLRVTKLTQETEMKIFVDIRLYKTNQIATKFGVTLLPMEFKYVMSKLRRNRIGLKQNGRRAIILTKSQKEAMNIKVISRKTTDIWLTKEDIKFLLENWRQIWNTISEARSSVLDNEMDEFNLNRNVEINNNNKVIDDETDL